MGPLLCLVPYVQGIKNELQCFQQLPTNGDNSYKYKHECAFNNDLQMCVQKYLHFNTDMKTVMHC